MLYLGDLGDIGRIERALQVIHIRGNSGLTRSGAIILTLYIE